MISQDITASYVNLTTLFDTKKEVFGKDDQIRPSKLKIANEFL
jgi:hypothetical protein